jgi:uncharacterized OB-fold protein
MITEKQEKRLAVIEGWFTMDPEDPRLIGNRCNACGDHFFPRALSCRNPDCMKEDLEEVLLSKRGKLWSYTNNYYPPPSPYVPPDPFVTYAIVVIELSEEKLMVMGQLADGYEFSDLRVGMEMELVVEPLSINDQGNEYVIWKWKPATAEKQAEKGGQ